MAKPRKKPDYRSELGAYSRAPRVEEVGDGHYTAEGNIECWRGSIEDLSRAGQAAVDALAEETTDPVSVSVSCTDSAGQHGRFASLEDFEASQSQTDSLGTVRIEIRKEPTDTTGTIVARPTLPGVLVSASGRNRIEVDGLARLLMGRMMPGYIDRYGGWWRWMAAAATPVVPGLLTYAIAADRWDDWSHAVVVAFAIAGTLLSLWLMGKGWRWTLYRTPLEFVPDAAPPGPDRRGQVERFLRRPWVARLIALIGLLILGIVTNKLSDLIPWP